MTSTCVSTVVLDAISMILLPSLMLVEAMTLPPDAAAAVITLPLHISFWFLNVRHACVVSCDHMQAICTTVPCKHACLLLNEGA